MDTIKKKILLVRHGTTEYNETGNAALSRLLLLENSRRRWALVDFWNSTSHLEAAI